MELNDPEAFVTSRELWSKAAELGSPGGHRNLAARYYNGEGVERDLKKAIYHWEKAAMGGHHMCRHDLGVQEEKKGNLTTRAIKHYIIAAKQGFDPSMYQVERGFEMDTCRKRYSYPHCLHISNLLMRLKVHNETKQKGLGHEKQKCMPPLIPYCNNT